MGFRINTNVAAMNAHMNSLNNNRALDKSLTALSTGLRINKAADDASGMAIANQLKSQANGLGQAIRNANDGINVTQTADGALEEYSNIINIVRTKAIQAASDGQNADSRKAIQADIDKLMEEAQNIASSTSFNGQTLLNGGFDNKSFHIGAYSGESVKIDIDDMQIANVGKFALASGNTEIMTTASSDTGNDLKLTVTANISGGTAITVSINIKSITKSEAEGLTTAQISLANAQKLADAFNAKAQDLNAGIHASVRAVGEDKGNVTGYSLRLDSDNSFDVKSGATTGGISAGNEKAETDGNNLTDIDVTTRDGAERAITITDHALKQIDKQRSNIGSVQNQLESTVRNISVTQVNVTAAESTIRDVDFAAESANLQKRNILAQSGVYAMSQANAAQQNVMRLLQ